MFRSSLPAFSTRCQCGFLIQLYWHSPLPYRIAEKKWRQGWATPSAYVYFEAEFGLHHVQIPLLTWILPLPFKRTLGSGCCF